MWNNKPLSVQQQQTRLAASFVSLVGREVKGEDRTSNFEKPGQHQELPRALNNYIEFIIYYSREIARRVCVKQSNSTALFM